MKNDRFWETFWIFFFSFAFLAFFASGTLFFYHVSQLNAAAVGVAFDPNRDPFESDTYRAKASLTDGYIYRNSLPLGLSQWGWDSLRDWNYTGDAYEGGVSIHATFQKQWAGFGINGFSAPLSSYHSLSLAVKPDAAVDDLYVEIYDQDGIAMRRQSIGWYAPSGSLTPGEWQPILIPLENLVSSPGKVTSITGISISTKNPGEAEIDALRLSEESVSHSVWTEPAEEWVPYNPFATSTPLSMPYTADFSPGDFARWFSYYGSFGAEDGAFTIGPKANISNDSVSVIRGGRNWSDYQADAALNWGAVSAFSLLVRFTDPENFASCAFSRYGDGVHIYEVKNGVSTDLGQSPTLPINDYAPWLNVRVGASVHGNRVSCYVKGEKVLSAVIPDLPSAGTAGMEAWDSNNLSAPHHVISFTVKQLLGE